MTPTEQDNELRQLVHMIQNADTTYDATKIILDWHNKQVEEVLDRLLEHGEDFTTFGDGGRSVAVEYIEAERAKLKEVK